jgi:hypothetical protein
MEDEVGSFHRILPLERFVEKRRADGRVQHDANVFSMRQAAHRRNIEEVAVGVAWRF